MDELRRRALRLEWITIGWNAAEVFVTIGLGIAARSLALVAFGMDSVIELFASLVVVWHLRDDDAASLRDRTARALRLVGIAFGVLAVVLTVAALRDLIIARRPGESPIGIAYLAATAVVMFSLAVLKRRIAEAMASEPLESEAAMTFLDGMLATGILTALVLNWALEWWWADPAATLVIAAVAFKEAAENRAEARELEAGLSRPERTAG